MLRLVTSSHYETAVVGLVMLNAAFVGLQIQHSALNGDGGARSAGWSAGEILFCILFSVELGFRWYHLGYDFLRGADWHWSCFDAVVVLMMVIERILDLISELDSNFLRQLSIMRILRVIRLVRVTRIIRMLKFFRELRMMLHSILNSFKSLLWVMLILVMTFYIFGITMTQGVVDHCSIDHSQCARGDGLLLKKFGRVDRSVLSLFEAMAGGISWGELLEVLTPLPITYSALFLLFITFAIFAVVNIVTGVFVESAMSSSQEDTESVIQDEIFSKESYVHSMQKVFDEMDTDSDGTITLDELKSAIEDEKMVAYFNALGLEITDVQTLFMLLDRDQTGRINVEEFLLGCMRLKGEAKSLDMAKLLYESDWVVCNIERLSETVQDIYTAVVARRSNSLFVDTSMILHQHMK